MQNKILHEILRGSRVFSVIAAESRDCSNQEQMPLITRFVDEHREIQEFFISFVNCANGITGKQSANLI